jgi:translation initiation factor 3 subunit A
VQEEEEARRQEEQARQHMLQEQKRLELEREERERKRQENEIQQIKDRHLKEKMQQISQTSHGQKILKKLNEDVSCHTHMFLVSFHETCVYSL